MHLETDTMTQRERLECLLNHREPDRVPCYLMGWPEYSDFYQEFKSKESSLFDPYTEDDKNILITPSGDYTLNVFFGADIIVRGNHVVTPPALWLDSDGNISKQQSVDKGVEQGERETYGSVEKGQKISERITYFGKHEKITILPNGYPYVWYEGGALKTPEKITEWFDTYGWPHELQVKDYGNDFNSTNTQFSKQLHLIPSYGPGLYEAAWFMMGQDRFAWLARKNPDFILGKKL
jgi:hypothetical protein